jgi:hypothetical protein
MGGGFPAIFRDFPGFNQRRPRWKGHSSGTENGINKKHLPQLISIVNLGTL